MSSAGLTLAELKHEILERLQETSFRKIRSWRKHKLMNNQEKKAALEPIFFLLLFICSLFGTSSFANDNTKLVSGARTLSKGKSAFSLDFGFDLPEPVLYGLRWDRGISDQYQLGIAGSFLGTAISFALNNTLSLSENRAAKRFFGFQITPIFIANFGENIGVILKPALVFEFAGNAQKDSWFFLKGKTYHTVATAGNVTSGNDWSKPLMAATFGYHKPRKKSALVVELGVITKLFKDPKYVFPIGKIGFTWAL